MKSKVLEYGGYAIHLVTISVFIALIVASQFTEGLKSYPYPGWILLVLGIILVLLSVITLRGEKTSKIITHGVFSLVRHPMYLGFMLLFLSMVCFIPHWVMITLCPINLLILYYFMVEGDQMNLEKFGEKYRRYMRTVPQVNILAGMVNWWKNRKR